MDVENDPTADGVEVGVEGTIYFTLNTDPAVLRQFDDKYGTREYRGQDGTLRHAYGSDEGWSRSATSGARNCRRPARSRRTRTAPW